MRLKNRRKLTYVLIAIGIAIVILGATLAVSAYAYRDELVKSHEELTRTLGGGNGGWMGFPRPGFGFARDKDGNFPEAGTARGFGPWNHYPMHGGGPFGWVIAVVIVGIIIFAGIRRRNMRHATMSGEAGCCCAAHEEPVSLLRRNFAEGKISEEEFLSKIAALGDKRRKS